MTISCLTMWSLGSLNCLQQEGKAAFSYSPIWPLLRFFSLWLLAHYLLWHFLVHSDTTAWELNKLVELKEIVHKCQELDVLRGEIAFVKILH